MTNSKTEMFSVYAGNARSSCLVIGAVASCSTHVGPSMLKVKVQRLYSVESRMCCLNDAVQYRNGWHSA